MEYSGKHVVFFSNIITLKTVLYINDATPTREMFHYSAKMIVYINYYEYCMYKFIE